MANRCGREPRWQHRLCVFTAGVDYPCGKLPKCRTRCRVGRVFSDAFSVALFHSDETETKRGKEVWRRCCVETIGSVVSSAGVGPIGLGETNIGDDTARTGHFGSIDMSFPPADLPVRGERKATFTNQSGGIDALAASPWPLSRTQTGADEKSAHCVISAESPWIILRGC